MGPLARLLPKSEVDDLIERAGLSADEIGLVDDALPDDGLPYSSNWMREAVLRVAGMRGVSPLRVLAALDRMLRACACRLPLEDAAIYLAQIEIARRKHGARGSAIEYPEGIDADEARRIVTSWEGMSYACGLAQPGDEGDALMVMATCATLACHLASTDGVPIRLDHLDPLALAAQVATGPDVVAGIPRPKGTGATLLRATAEIYDRLRERGILDAPITDPIARRLRELALGFVEMPSVA